MEKQVRYSREFKLEAVRLLKEKHKPVSELAMELGVKRTLIYRWKDEVEAKGDRAFKGSGRLNINDKCELDRLKQELKTVKTERDILKKATAYFAKDLK